MSRWASKCTSATGPCTECTACSAGQGDGVVTAEASTTRCSASVSSARSPLADLSDRLGRCRTGWRRCHRRRRPGRRANGATSSAGLYGLSSRDACRIAAGPNRAPGPVGDPAVERHPDHRDVVVARRRRAAAAARTSRGPRSAAPPSRRPARRLRRRTPRTARLRPLSSSLSLVGARSGPDRVDAAVDVHHLTDHRRQPEVGQELDRRGHLVGRADPAQRDRPAAYLACMLARSTPAPRRRRPRSCGVSVTPGATALTMMPSGASSRPSVLTSEISPALAAAYAVASGPAGHPPLAGDHHDAPGARGGACAAAPPAPGGTCRRGWCRPPSTSRVSRARASGAMVM